MDSIKNYRDYIGTREDKFYKATLFKSNHLMVGLNCLEVGQEQAVHAHADQDKFYLVLEGEGLFTIGEKQQLASAGHVVWAAAGKPHGVKNEGQQRLIIFMGIAPSP